MIAAKTCVPLSPEHKDIDNLTTLQGSLYMKAFIDKPWEENLDKALKHYLTPEEAQLVWETWQIGQRKSDLNPVDLGLVQFITDVRFYWPVVRTIHSAPANANLHVYHFHQVRSEEWSCLSPEQPT